MSFPPAGLDSYRSTRQMVRCAVLAAQRERFSGSLGRGASIILLFVSVATPCRSTFQLGMGCVPSRRVNFDILLFDGGSCH